MSEFVALIEDALIKSGYEWEIFYIPDEHAYVINFNGKTFYLM